MMLGFSIKTCMEGIFCGMGTSFFLTDLHRAEILRSVSLDQTAMESLPSLSFPAVPYGGRRISFGSWMDYFGGDPLDLRRKEQPAFERFSPSWRNCRRRWWKKPDQALSEGEHGIFGGERGGNDGFHRRDFPFRSDQEVIRTASRHGGGEPGSVVKECTRIRCLSGYNRRTNICVKQFRYPHWVDRFKENFRTSKGLKAWIAGNGLKIRGIFSLGSWPMRRERMGLG